MHTAGAARLELGKSFAGVFVSLPKRIADSLEAKLASRFLMLKRL
jgi:hypothetical protein